MSSDWGNLIVSFVRLDKSVTDRSLTSGRDEYRNYLVVGEQKQELAFTLQNATEEIR